MRHVHWPSTAGRFGHGAGVRAGTDAPLAVVRTRPTMTERVRARSSICSQHPSSRRPLRTATAEAGDSGTTTDAIRSRTCPTSCHGPAGRRFRGLALLRPAACRSGNDDLAEVPQLLGSRRGGVSRGVRTMRKLCRRRSSRADRIAKSGGPVVVAPGLAPACPRRSKHGGLVQRAGELGAQVTHGAVP